MVAVSPTLPAPGLSAKRSKPELRSSPSSGSIALPDSTDSDDDAVDDDAKPSRITPQMLVGGALVGVLFIIVAVGVSSAHSQPRIAPLSPLAQLPLKVLSHPRIRAYSARIRSLWQPSATSAAQSDGAPHPILPLLLGARASWATLVSAQPRSLAQARKAYADRYAPLRPPPGFDQWYHFARARNFTLIDAFDGLMEDLAHYRGLGGNELRRRTKELASVSGVSLLTVKAGSVEIKTKSGRWAPAMAVKEMIEAVETGYNYELDAAPEGSAMRKIFEQWELPDFEMAINERAEGRVLPKLARELPRKLAGAFACRSRGLSSLTLCVLSCGARRSGTPSVSRRVSAGMGHRGERVGRVSASLSSRLLGPSLGRHGPGRRSRNWRRCRRRGAIDRSASPRHQVTPPRDARERNGAGSSGPRDDLLA